MSSSSETISGNFSSFFSTQRVWSFKNENCAPDACIMELNFELHIGVYVELRMTVTLSKLEGKKCQNLSSSRYEIYHILQRHTTSYHTQWLGSIIAFDQSN